MTLRAIPTVVAALAVLTTLPSTAGARVQHPTEPSAAAVEPAPSDAEVALAADDELPPPRPSAASPATNPAADEELDARREAIRKLRIRGVVTLTVGGCLVVLGGGLAGGYGNGSFGPKVLWTGVGFAAVGLPVFVGGMIAFAVSNKRARALASERTASLRVAPMLARGQAGLSFTGRF